MRFFKINMRFFSQHACLKKSHVDRTVMLTCKKIHVNMKVTMSTCKSFHDNMHFFLNMHVWKKMHVDIDLQKLHVKRCSSVW
jgi:hypothetical protein